MDISKLPRLSQTPAHSANPSDATAEATGPASPPTATAPHAPPQVWCGQCNAPNAPGSAYCNGCGAALRPNVNYASAGAVDPGVGAEVWLSAIVGVVLMLFGMTFAKWALTTMVGGTYSTGLTWGAPVPGQPNQHPEGSPIAYWDLAGFTALQDAALFLFGFAMVLEAVVLLAVHSRLRAKVPLLLVALTVTLTATVLNLVVCAKIVAAGALPLMSLLAVGFGGYIAVYEWRLLQHFRAARA
jgi:hypothetical protein